MQLPAAAILVPTVEVTMPIQALTIQHLTAVTMERPMPTAILASVPQFMQIES